MSDEKIQFVKYLLSSIRRFIRWIIGRWRKPEPPKQPVVKIPAPVAALIVVAAAIVLVVTFDAITKVANARLRLPIK
jgi:hypothetical protein